MKRQRTKCFTGCWTCRSRRVKCDEEAPSCRRCRQMGVTCGGYGLRLSWVQYNPLDSPDVEESSQPETRASRRALVSRGTPTTLARLDSPELDTTLATLDTWRPEDSSTLENGAFCVFAVHPPAVGTIPRNPSQDTAEDGTIPDLYAASTTETLHEESHNTLAIDPIQAFDDLREAGTCTAQSPSHLERQDHVQPPRHLDALSMPSKQKRLIHHWITFTSRKIVLIDEAHNPCRTMMLPMALKGLVSESGGSNADVAIFHAVCASAAYNLFELCGRSNEQDRVLALYHDNEAVHHLRHNLARAHEHRDQSFAMAIMACIAVEAISGTTQRWRTHVSGGLAYLAQLQSRGVPELALSAFRQHIVKMAILCGLAVPEDLKAFLHDESGASDGLEFTFPYYGVSRSFLRAQDHINTLLLDTETTTTTPTREKDLDAFELQLYLDYPSPPPPPPSPSQNPTTAPQSLNSTVIHHTSMAFYYAGLVFFQRSARHKTSTTVQDLVELGLQELEAIDHAGQGALGCLMLWPVLVLGAGCDGTARQERMRSWFRAQRRLGFRNLVVLEDLVATVWRDRARAGDGGGEVDWRRVIAQSEFDVFRL